MTAHTYPPPEPHSIPPPTNNTLSSKERSALVRSTKKLGRMLGDIPRFVDDIEDRECLIPSLGILLMKHRIRHGHASATTHPSCSFQRKLVEESKTDSPRPAYEAL